MKVNPDSFQSLLFVCVCLPELVLLLEQVVVEYVLRSLLRHELLEGDLARVEQRPVDRTSALDLLAVAVVVVVGEVELIAWCTLGLCDLCGFCLEELLLG